MKTFSATFRVLSSQLSSIKAKLKYPIIMNAKDSFCLPALFFNLSSQAMFWWMDRGSESNCKVVLLVCWAVGGAACLVLLNKKLLLNKIVIWDGFLCFLWNYSLFGYCCIVSTRMMNPFGPIKLDIFTLGIEQIVPDDNFYAEIALICIHSSSRGSIDVLNTA